MFEQATSGDVPRSVARHASLSWPAWPSAVAYQNCRGAPFQHCRCCSLCDEQAAAEVGHRLGQPVAVIDGALVPLPQMLVGCE